MKILTDYTEKNIYEMIILPLFKKNKTEISGFADEKVFITKEVPGGKSGPGWSDQLARDGYIKLPDAGGKYVELE